MLGFIVVPPNSDREMKFGRTRTWPVVTFIHNTFLAQTAIHASGTQGDLCDSSTITIRGACDFDVGIVGHQAVLWRYIAVHHPMRMAISYRCKRGHVRGIRTNVMQAS